MTCSVIQKVTLMICMQRLCNNATTTPQRYSIKRCIKTRCLCFVICTSKLTSAKRIRENDEYGRNRVLALEANIDEKQVVQDLYVLNFVGQ
jgi:hypothetical protein